MQRRNQELWRRNLNPDASEILGAVQPREVDLFHVTSQGAFGLNPVIRPNNLKTIYTKEEHGRALEIALEIQARGDQGDSDIMRVEVAWDWTFQEGSSEIRDHLQVLLKKVEPPAVPTTATT